VAAEAEACASARLGTAAASCTAEWAYWRWELKTEGLSLEKDLLEGWSNGVWRGETLDPLWPVKRISKKTIRTDQYVHRILIIGREARKISSSSRADSSASIQYWQMLDEIPSEQIDLRDCWHLGSTTLPKDHGVTR
jgi:hypothetical protein